MPDPALREFVELQRGNTYKSALLGMPGPKLLGLGSIQRNGGFKGENLKSYGGESDPRILLGPGDIYVSLKDVTQSADLLGAVARVPPEIKQGRLTQDTVKLVFKEGAPVSLIYWVLRSPEYREFCRSFATGTTNLGLPREDFLAYPIPEPTSARIQLVALLDALDDKIELNRRMNETLEAIARAIFKDWFVDFGPTRAKNAGRAPYLAADIWSLFPDALNEDGGPKGWGTESVYDQAIWVNGAAYKDMHFSSESDALPVVKIAELKSGITKTTRFTNTDLGERYRILDGELLFSWSGNPDTSIDAFVWTAGPAWLNQHIFAVRPNGKRSQAFLYAMLKFLRSEFAEIARNKQTTGLGHVTQQDLIRLKVNAPSHEVGVAFDKIVGPLHARFTSNLFENQSLVATRDFLLPKLMSGEVRVKDAEKLIGEAT